MSSQPLCLLLSGPRRSTSSSQPRSTAWFCLGISKPSTSSGHLRLLYNSHRVAPGRTQVGNDLGLHHPGKPRACTLSGQLQTTSEHHHPAPAQLIFHKGWRLVVNGDSWSLPLTTWVNPSHWPANTNQGSTTRGRCTQPTQGVHPEYPAWVIGEAVGPYRTPTTLGHATKTGTHSSST